MSETVKLIICIIIYIVLAFDPAKEICENIRKKGEKASSESDTGNNRETHKGSCKGSCNDGLKEDEEKFSLFDENLLMVIASLGAFIMGEYIEAIAVLALYKIGELFEDRAVDKARDNIASLMDIRPEFAYVANDKNLLDSSVPELTAVEPASVKPGDIIYIKAGERVPLDGILLDICSNEGGAVTYMADRENIAKTIVDGTSTGNVVETTAADRVSTENSESKTIHVTHNAKLDTSALTGESKIRIAKPGDEILSGFVNVSASNIDVLQGNRTGILKIKVTKEYGESTVARILDMVENAADKKSRSEAFITKFARVYTPIVCGLAAALAVIGPLVSGMVLGGEYNWSMWIYRALTFLVISCPCALVISIPLSFFAGIGGASRAGILIKGANYIETLSKVKHIAFDKTGTLTRGIIELGTQNDELKPETHEAIIQLKKLGIRETYMLTGDRREVGEAIGRQAGIDKVYAELLPADKVKVIETLLSGKQDPEQINYTDTGTKDVYVAYVGDGINDAPVLMLADVGIAMGAMGTDAAVEAADIVLMDDSLKKIPQAIRISKKCMRIVYENIVFAIGIKVICLILGALGIANMWMAIFADVGVMILAVLNAMRALR